jgi:Na+/H+ antiporter NhaA
VHERQCARFHPELLPGLSNRQNPPVSESRLLGFSGRTAWARNLETPLRSFLRTETASAAGLLGAALAALVWANVDAGSYERTWHTTLAISLGRFGISHPLQYWVNSGLMTFFFFVVGLEARREFDMGELRERRRLALPVAAGLGGMIVPVAIFLAVNAGSSAEHGFGVSMSSDTAFALGMLALVGPHFPDRLRAFLLTISVVDDVTALVVIAIVYSDHLAWTQLGIGLALLGAATLTVVSGARSGFAQAVVGAAAWVAMSKSGVDPIIVGLVLGLGVFASPAARIDLERASDLFRLFREQPTPELARTASVGLQAAISPNERLQQLYHPWTSYAIVPLFALANAGLSINANFLAHAYTSPITLGVLFGYVAGKPIGIAGTSALLSRLSRGRIRPPVGWAAVTGGGMIAGIGFTVALLIASLAFHGSRLAEAKLGLLSAAVCSSTATWLLFRTASRLPTPLKIRALIGTSEAIIDLADPVDPKRDHIRGPADAKVTLVEYGDLECPFCGQAEPVIRQLLAESGDLRYVWRHLPLNDVHPQAQVAAEASEAASAQGMFWEMHDRLLSHQDALRPPDLIAAARELGLDEERFADDLRRHAGASRVAEDVDSADLSGVSGTPSFFVNGLRHQGAYDLDSLTAAVKVARARAALAARAPG